MIWRRIHSSPSSEVPYPRERALPVVKIESVSVAFIAIVSGIRSPIGDIV